MKIGIFILATNAYLPLGLRLINRFNHFYNGSAEIKFFIVSNRDPKDYIPEGVNYLYIRDNHKDWLAGTNSKFYNMLLLENEDIDYLFYMDADTNIHKPFNQNWMLAGDMVGAEHFGNRDWMKDEKPYDRNPRSKAYIPLDTKLPQTYYHAAFFGGTKAKMMTMCETLLNFQQEDKKIPHEPIWNDESYVNYYFHNNPPSIIPFSEFQFTASDGGGIEDKRNPNIDIQHLIQGARQHKNKLWNIANNKIVGVTNG